MKNFAVIGNNRLKIGNTRGNCLLGLAVIKALIPIALLAVLAQPAISSSYLQEIAVLPDPETYHFIAQKYNLLLEQDRSGCAYYADPTMVQGDQATRKAIVLFTESSDSGTLCRGMFRFEWLEVNCKTNQVTYTNAIGSPASWKPNTQTNPKVTTKVCALPTQNFETTPPRKSKIRPLAK